MGTIKVKKGKKEKTYSFPDSYNECNEKQFIACCKYFLDVSILWRKNPTLEMKKNIMDTFLQSFIPFEGKHFSWLDDFTKYKLLEEMKWIQEEESIQSMSFLEPKIQTLKVGKVELFGIHRNFGNVTWEEFIWADQCFIDRNNNMLAAILFREAVEYYQNDRDIRVDFNRYQLGKRMELISKLPQEKVLAILLQYKAMRNASLELKYSAIFPEFSRNVESETDSVTDLDENEVETKFSWVKVHQNIMGDDIMNEKSLLKLDATTVLNNLNNRIIKNRKTPRG